jgi:hypothetical protein
MNLLQNWFAKIETTLSPGYANMVSAAHTQDAIERARRYAVESLDVCSEDLLDQEWQQN